MSYKAYALPTLRGLSEAEIAAMAHQRNQYRNVHLLEFGGPSRGSNVLLEAIRTMRYKGTVNLHVRFCQRTASQQDVRGVTGQLLRNSMATMRDLLTEEEDEASLIIAGEATYLDRQHRTAP